MAKIDINLLTVNYSLSVTKVNLTGDICGPISSECSDHNAWFCQTRINYKNNTAYLIDAVGLSDHPPNISVSDHLPDTLTLDYGEKLKIHYKCKRNDADVI